MNKLFKSAILLSSLLLMTACSTSGNESSSNNNSEDSSVIPPEPVYTVTEAEFDEALTLRFKNLTYTATAVQGPSSTRTEMIKMEFLADGSLHQYASEVAHEFYWRASANNEYKKISNDNDTWYVSYIDSREDYVENSYKDDGGFLPYADFAKTNYSSFTYDEANKKYTGTLTIAWMSTDWDFELKFVDKKLVELATIPHGYSMDNANIISVTNYGTTTIDFDSLNYYDNIYVDGRTFNFSYVSGDIPGGYTYDEVNAANALSSIAFGANNIFTLDMKGDPLFSLTEHVYTGTYTVSCDTFKLIITSEGDPIEVNGEIRFDSSNYVSGAIAEADTSLGHLTFSL